MPLSLAGLNPQTLNRCTTQTKLNCSIALPGVSEPKARQFGRGKSSSRPSCPRNFTCLSPHHLMWPLLPWWRRNAKVAASGPVKASSPLDSGGVPKCPQRVPRFAVVVLWLRQSAGKCCTLYRHFSRQRGDGLQATKSHDVVMQGFQDASLPRGGFTCISRSKVASPNAL